MPTIQIKTLEQLIIRELCGMNGYNQLAQIAFTHVLQHFAEEEYLYGIEHRTIIEKIYVHHFYKYKSTEALSQELHIDTKTLLTYSKAYVRLFAKQYFRFELPTDTDFFLLYSALTTGTAIRHKEQKRS